MSETRIETPTETADMPNEALAVGRKWAATIAYVILFITQAWVTNRLFEQNARIEKIVERNEAEACEIRQESRETLRNVLFGIMDHFPPSDDIESLRQYVQVEYPEVDCPAPE
jgi:alpha-D-ribose 1-methylphosphonate 5-triphosphate diphosphatase PhnM